MKRNINIIFVNQIHRKQIFNDKCKIETSFGSNVSDIRVVRHICYSRFQQVIVKNRITKFTSRNQRN